MLYFIKLIRFVNYAIMKLDVENVKKEKRRRKFVICIMVFNWI